MAGTHVAVIDVGKTNKKVLVFDRSLKLVDSAYRGFEERVEGAAHLEDLSGMSAWLLDQLGTFARQYDIGAVSVTTHGATLVCIDKNGGLAVPPIAYTTETDKEFDDDFYRVCGDARELQKTTATAAFGLLINAAKTLHYARTHYPEGFARIDCVLNMPQYFGYLLTGNKGAEPTYLGCHTYLLDFDARDYSVVADRLGVRDKLPPLAPNSWTVLGSVSEQAAKRTGLSRDCIVTMGIHDSNSSLLPYLVKGHDNFVLNSTGTWCVAMHPTNAVSFAEDELGKLVFYNLDAFFQPVKTTIFMGGQEFDTWCAAFKKVNGRGDYPGLDLERCARIVSERKLFILPSVVRGTGLFPHSKPRAVEGERVFALEDIAAGGEAPAFMRNHETASAVLNMSLAIQSSIALGMAGYNGAGSIFTEGGFRRNATYNGALAALFPSSRVATTRLDEATAFGAAMLGRAALDKSTPMETRDLFDIEIVDVPAPRLPGIAQYAEDLRARIAAG
jgi:L-fuculokinase